MTLRPTLLVLISALAITLGTQPTAADHHAATQPAEGATPAAAPTTQPSMEEMQQEMMEKWMQFATPGMHHGLLEQRVGHWNHKVRIWHSPDTPPAESTGTTETKMIMGGRYLMDMSEGSFEGQPFQGLGLAGYDNLKQKYFSTWLDNMGTGIMIAEGDVDDTGRVFTYQCTYSCPMTGGIKHSKTIETVVDENTWTMQMFEPGPDGKEWMSFEIVYTRATKD